MMHSGMHACSGYVGLINMKCGGLPEMETACVLNSEAMITSNSAPYPFWCCAYRNEPRKDIFNHIIDLMAFQ